MFAVPTRSTNNQDIGQRHAPAVVVSRTTARIALDSDGPDTVEAVALVRAEGQLGASPAVSAGVASHYHAR